VDGNVYSDHIRLDGVEVTGELFGYNLEAQLAYQAALQTYLYLNALPCDGHIVHSNQTFQPGVYCYNGSIHPTRKLNFTFDAQGDPTVIFVLIIEGNVQGVGGEMHLINGAQECNVFVLMHGSLQPTANASLLGIWLIKGDVDPVGEISLRGKFIALGPGLLLLLSEQPWSGRTLVGQGNINPMSPLTVSSCQCFTGQPTATPTLIVNDPSTGSWVTIGLVFQRFCSRCRHSLADATGNVSGYKKSGKAEGKKKKKTFLGECIRGGGIFIVTVHLLHPFPTMHREREN
jgi:hypothetical protein